MTKILAINGSYRDGGITDQAVNLMAQAVQSLGAEVEIIHLREYPIEFCLNCRECTQQAGESVGKCVQRDGMEELVRKIEQSDAFVLASPTNFSSVTAIFKRFMERLVVYAYWPWGANAPKPRKKELRKKAVLISSSAAPGFLGRYFFETHKQLTITANIIGASSVGTLSTGLIAKEPDAKLPKSVQRRISSLAKKLV